MKSANHLWNTRTVARTAGVFLLALVMIGISITPVLAHDYRKHYKPKKYHGRYYAPRAYYQPAPVYVAPPPPPVVYAPPPPPPGISIVFPIHIR